MATFNTTTKMPTVINLVKWIITLSVLITLAKVLPTTQFLNSRWFDNLSVLFAPQDSALPIVIVGIDEPSFTELDKKWPWPRSTHAQLIDNLTDQKAKLVVFDVLFSEMGSPNENKILATALKKNAHVILASDRVNIENSQFMQTFDVQPIDSLKVAASGIGITSIELDKDGFVRRIPTFSNAMWKQVLSQLKENPSEVVSNTALIRYGDRNFKYLSYYQVLNSKLFLPDEFLKEKIVFVGLNVKTPANTETSKSDLWPTPYLRTNQVLMSGVEIQAHILASVYTNRAIEPVSNYLITLSILLTIIIFWLGSHKKSPLIQLSTYTSIVFLIVLVNIILFTFLKYWLNIAESLTSLTLFYGGQISYSIVNERKQKTYIRNAFGRYLSKEVVDQIIQDKTHLELGGQNRTLTILFTDIVGFTTIAEKLTAEEVTLLLNRYLSLMTDIILEENGTVDKFIGDAIMAFWGAPLDHENHADAAIRSAQKMQSAADALRAEFKLEGLPPIYMRIGVHTGDAVVGNLGSNNRFDYTAIGDNVNLAARLESANKQYGTSILISEETKHNCKNKFQWQPVDKVIVVGKSTPVNVFTLSDDDIHCKMTAKAIFLFQNRKWNEAEEAWKSLLELDKQNKLPELYLERIHNFRTVPPDENWDGTTTLGSK